MKDKSDMDWNTFGSIDMKTFEDSLAKNSVLVNDFGTYISFVSIDDHFERDKNDQNFINVFKVTQILLKYLLNEFNRNNNCVNDGKSHNNLIKENKKLRKLLEIHQKAMTYRSVSGDNGADYVQCPHCPKVFFGTNFLKTHLSRRHPNESLDSKGMLCLTKTIDNYQRVVLGGNKGLDQMKNELQVLTEKLTKTELDLVAEKEERIKLEERIEYVLKMRDKELEQSWREELKELKFVNKESHFNREFESIDQNNTSDQSNDKSLQSIGKTNKIEKMITIQAKEMIRLGDNFQKLVSHLTHNLSENSEEKSKPLKVTKSKDILKNFGQNHINVSEDKDKAKDIREDKRKDKGEDKLVSDVSLKRDLKEINSKVIQKYDEKENIIDLNDVFNGIEESLNDKLKSFGIDINCRGISEEQYLESIRCLNEERDLLIQQNRFDYDFDAIEQQIRHFVHKKVSEDYEYQKDMIKTVPKVQERKVKTNKNIINEIQTKRVDQNIPIEAIVKIKTISNSMNTSVDQSMAESMDENVSQVSQKTPKPPKSALKSVKTDGESDVKVKDRRIHFSDHRIEHQISPEESSEEISDGEETTPMVPNTQSYISYDESQTLSAPIPAQRSLKNSLSLDLKSEPKDQTNDYSIEDSNYEIDEQIMDEILETNSLIDNKRRSEEQTTRSQKSSKVQELTEMIEQQLNKRSIAHKKPPIGSVNVMSSDKSLSGFDSEESD